MSSHHTNTRKFDTQKAKLKNLWSMKPNSGPDDEAQQVAKRYKNANVFKKHFISRNAIGWLKLKLEIGRSKANHSYIHLTNFCNGFLL